MQLSQIWVYPVKSLPGIRLPKATIDARGLRWDRHWMCVDDNGLFLSQRRLPAMSQIRVSLETHGISLHADGQPTLSVAFGQADGRQLPVRVWDDELIAEAVSPEADHWLSSCLDATVRLVRMPQHVLRQVDQAYALPGDQTGFADGFPFLLLGEASIEDLDRRVADPGQRMEVRRFRPNLVISGSVAYAEDQWRRVQIGELTFRVVKPCSRCIITTINPDTGLRGSEPLQTLKGYRKRGNKVFFGQNVVQDAQGQLAEGDTLQVLEAD